MKMKLLGISLGAVAVTALAAPGLAGELDPGLARILDEAPANEVVSTLVFLSDQVDINAFNDLMQARRAPLDERRMLLGHALRNKASETQGALLAHLDDLTSNGLVESYHAFWIANVIRVDTYPSQVRALSDRNDVLRVYFNYGIEGIAPVSEDPDVHGDQGGFDNPEIGQIAIRAPEVWADFGITGVGVLVSTLDTGVDGNHPAVASRWAGLESRYSGHPEWAWFDPVTNTTFPTAFGSHGTHTMGTVCGGAPGDEVGTAPGAHFIHAAVIDRVSIPRTVSDAILAFEWSADPDGDPNTTWDVPDTSSNSWGLMTAHGYPPCDQTFWTYLDALEAMGCVVIFSAGNEGSSGLRRPADRATDDFRTFAVAAVDANNPDWPIAYFSSRGPTNCTPDGSPAIKPDIAAPGVNVRSSVPGGGYSNFSGTSMASPHINGVVALMREINPDIPVEDTKQIIFDTAVDLGATGEDNSYGWGMVDAYEAVIAASTGEIPMRITASRLVAGVRGDIEVNRATPGAVVAFLYSLTGEGSTYISQLDVTVDLANPALAGIRTADSNGHALLRRLVPENAQGRTLWLQAAEFQRKSNVLQTTVQ